MVMIDRNCCVREKRRETNDDKKNKVKRQKKNSSRLSRWRARRDIARVSALVALAMARIRKRLAAHATRVGAFASVDVEMPLEIA